jgi:predicted nucleic acid-binding protein
MRIVLDNNILFSLMNPFSTASYIFFLLDTDFSAPEYVKLEFEKYKEICLFKSKLSKHEFEIRLEEIKEKIKFVKLQEYKKFLKKSEKSLPDPKDSPYLALALKLNSIIWSNDPHLKQQSLVKVFTTTELFKKMLNSEFTL